MVRGQVPVPQASHLASMMRSGYRPCSPNRSSRCGTWTRTRPCRSCTPSGLSVGRSGSVLEVGRRVRAVGLHQSSGNGTTGLRSRTVRTTTWEGLAVRPSPSVCGFSGDRRVKSSQPFGVPATSAPLVALGRGAVGVVPRLAAVDWIEVHPRCCSSTGTRCGRRRPALRARAEPASARRRALKRKMMARVVMSSPDLERPDLGPVAVDRS